MTTEQRLIGDVGLGMALPELRKRPTATMLFRFSACTWNAHRIHYDRAYAQEEGHPDILVQATMHGAFLLQMLQAFVGPAGRIRRFRYSNRGKALPGETLVCGGVVTAVDAATGEVSCDIWEAKGDGSICAPGSAVLWLPSVYPDAGR